MLKLFSEAQKNPFMFPQHIVSVCINKPGVDIALAQEISIGSAGAGLVPNPCRSPGCRDNFRDISRLEMSSCILTAGPASGDTPSQALGQLCLLPQADAILHGKDMDVASEHPQAGETQHNISALFFIYAGILKVEKQPRNPTYIWLVFH